MQTEMDKHTRMMFHDWFKMFITFDKVSEEALKSALTKRADLLEPEYGRVNNVDFGVYSNFVAKALAYNNKQFFVYRAIDNPNKIGFLSHKQYMRLLGKVGRYYNHDCAVKFLRENGKMSSPYKLFKKALKENPRMAFLKDFFPINVEGECTNEDKLILLCDSILSKTNNLEIIETTIQDCYNLNLPDRYNGSGHRFATHSCMQGKPVGKFYEALPCHGMMIKRAGTGIGRFLLWNLPDGRQYVDRLYCRETEASACLELIDRVYPKALKYPLENAGTINIKFKDLSVFEREVVLPYVDSFPNLMERNGELYMSNNGKNHDGLEFQTTVHFATGGTGYQIKRCPHCNKIWVGYRTNMTVEERNHKYVCDGYKPRNKELQAYLKVYREMQNELGGITDGTEGFVYEV